MIQRRRFAAALPLLGLLFLIACRSAPPPYDVTRLFAVGTSPNAEIDALRERLAAHGFRTVVLRRGDALAAFVAEHEDGRSALRIATLRGVVLAMDAPHSAQHRFDRLGLAEQERDDLDADGFPDAIVDGYDAALDRHCLALLHTNGSGALEERPLALPSLGAEWCLRSLSNRAPLEGHFELRWPGLASAPIVRATLRGRPWRVLNELAVAGAEQTCHGDAFLAAVTVALEGGTQGAVFAAFDDVARACAAAEHLVELRSALEGWGDEAAPETESPGLPEVPEEIVPPPS